MIDFNMITSGGKKKRSGRKSIRDEKDYFRTLDIALPSVVEFLVGVVKEAQKIDKKNKDYKWKIETGIKAANILQSKAPQRVQGPGDSGEFVFKLIGGNYAL